MNAPNLLLIWSDNPGLSLAIWLGVVVVAMYLARTPAHQLIRSTSRMIRSGMRLAARSIHKMEEQLGERNKEVILAIGKEATERVIEREFHRVNAVVARDLAAYPAVHRQISEVIGQLEEDYRNAADVPPLPPAWLDAVNSIAKIKHSGDATVGRILDNIRETVETAHQETLKEYQKDSRERHGLLKAMLPSWRKLTQSLDQVKNTIDGLDERTKFIDEKMQTYEAIRAGEDRAAQMLSSSSLTQFFIAGLVLLIAILGGVINFQLIALPMSEMVGGTSQLGPVRTADVAAMVIIMVEVAMGLFLLESLRITRLFPIIGSMDDTMRKRMIVITFSILAILAGIEASLAYMRDLLALDREAITQSLTAGGVVEAQFRWIPSIGQMVMGFILPFTLAFVAIPLESFIHSSRTVLGLSAAAVLRSAAFAVRFTGNVAYQLGNVMIGVYDLVIMLPLRLEQVFARRKNTPEPEAASDFVEQIEE
jgi:hypothetical protein